VGRSNVSRFARGLGDIAGGATSAKVARTPHRRIHVLLCFCG
jgi:hypothetical protein